MTRGIAGKNKIAGSPARGRAEGLVMRIPSIVSHDAERDTYLVLDDVGVDSVALGARPTPKALIA